MIYSGTLKYVLNFYHLVKVKTESGYETSEEQLYMIIKGDKIKNKMTYDLNAQEEFHPNTLTFKTYYRSGVELTDIVEVENKKYYIVSLDSDKFNNEITLVIRLINE